MFTEVLPFLLWPKLWVAGVWADSLWVKHSFQFGHDMALNKSLKTGKISGHQRALMCWHFVECKRTWNIWIKFLLKYPLFFLNIAWDKSHLGFSISPLWPMPYLTLRTIFGIVQCLIEPIVIHPKEVAETFLIFTHFLTFLMDGSNCSNMDFQKDIWAMLHLVHACFSFLRSC